MEKKNQPKASHLQQDKFYFKWILIGVYVWLLTVAFSRQPEFSWSMDPSYGPGGRLDYTRSTLRTYQSGTRSAWKSKHTWILLITIAGTYWYLRKYNK